MPTTATDRGSQPSPDDQVDPIVADAYRQAVTAEIEASATSDASSALLAATHLDPLLRRLMDRLTARRLEGQATRSAATSKAATTIVSITVRGDTAEVVECTIDDAVVFTVATGATVNDKVVTQRRRAALRRDGDTWKVADRVNEHEWEGVTTCATS